MPTFRSIAIVALAALLSSTARGQQAASSPTPEITWHATTRDDQPLFAYIYTEDAHAGSTRIRVLAASLLKPGAHKIDITTRRDPHGPEENIQTVDFANRPNVDGLRWSLRIDDAPDAHGKYPCQWRGDAAPIPAPSGTVHANEEAAILAQAPAAFHTLSDAVNSPDRLVFWFRLQDAPGWHGDAPNLSDASLAPLTAADTTNPSGACQVLYALEGAVEQRRNIFPDIPNAVADAGILDLKQAAPLLELLWTSPSELKDTDLRQQIIVAAARIGQPLDILRQAAADSSNTANELQAAIGLAEQGDPAARTIILNQVQRDLQAGVGNLATDARILNKWSDADFKKALQSLSPRAPDAARRAALNNLIDSLDTPQKSVDDLIALEIRNSSNPPEINAIFQALGERATFDDIPTLEQLPPLNPNPRSFFDGMATSAKRNAIMRIQQRFWREADRSPAAPRPLPGLPSPSDNSMP